jgi:hypothetical protein
MGANNTFWTRSPCSTHNCDNETIAIWEQQGGKTFTKVNGSRLSLNNFLLSGLCDDCQARVAEENELNQKEIL